ncbi:hypothetical protein [Nitrosomonas sp. Nm33]|uniref:hypothetical protein n=1 Tax=Nitrosomonas sp. Nm33 TaxID=133724 RepID=UPI00089C3175|nr:hypothetical protein [Nitrosomonas sp. Nm33]SDY17452.1 hypothetical protein SAMN05421755_101026 [Nitrosomonas sp. Nm33]
MSKDELTNQFADYIAMAAKVSLGVVPFVGSLLAELAGSVIPNQRIDRITKFALVLEQRLSDLEKDKLRDQVNNPDCGDLLEEGMRQAASSLSDERRQYIANLIANGISSDEIQHHESKHLLKLLGELSDVEVVWLRFYADETIRGDEEFRESHAAILDVEPAHMNSPQSVHDKNSLKKSYKNHLVRLGLLQEKYAVDTQTKQPKIDNQGQLEVKGHSLTSLGRLLLRSIGLPDGLS